MDNSKHILLSISNVQLNPAWSQNYENEEQCVSGEKGSVVVYEGHDTDGPVRSKFCKIHPPDILSNGHSLVLNVPLYLISEFMATASVMNNYCGAHFYRSLVGMFSSPYYPASYPINMACYWFIEPTLGNSVILNIESMDIEDSGNCNRDYLEIREMDSDRLLGVYCGNQPVPAIGPASSLTILFRSDDNGVVGTGFKASYNYGNYSILLSFYRKTFQI